MMGQNMQLYDVDRTPLRNYPNVIPFESRIVEAEVLETGVGVNGNRVLYSAAFETPIEIVGFERGIWMSIALDSPTINNYQWEWSRANGLGVAYQHDVLNDDLTIISADLYYGIYGLFYAPPMIDTDGDGVYDEYDECENTTVISNLDEQGCSDYQRDSDEDGFTDDVDQCPVTLPGEPVDFAGCSMEQVDHDSDGVIDAYDDCLATPEGATVDMDGCSDVQAGNARFNIYYNNFFTNYDFMGMALASDTHSKAYAYVTVGAQAKLVDRISWVGSSIEETSTPSFRITYHLAIPEAPHKPWTYVWNSYDVIAHSSEDITLYTDGTAKQAQIFTAELPETLALHALGHHHFSIQYLDSSASNTWEWFGNSHATGYSNLGDNNESDTTLIPGRLYMQLSHQ